MNGVPRCFPGETIVCLGGGPSLTQADVDACRGRARVIAIKDALRLAPWADVLYCGDEKWWEHHGPTLDFVGSRFAVNPNADRWATVLGISGTDGLEMSDPTSLRTGKTSGYQAIGLAVHLGASKIALLGYDMQPSAGKDHWFGAHQYTKKPPPYRHLGMFDQLVEPLKQAGIAIWNCSRMTAVTCFPTCSLAEALA